MTAQFVTHVGRRPLNWMYAATTEHAAYYSDADRAALDRAEYEKGGGKAYARPAGQLWQRVAEGKKNADYAIYDAPVQASFVLRMRADLRARVNSDVLAVMRTNPGVRGGLIRAGRAGQVTQRGGIA